MDFTEEGGRRTARQRAGTRCGRVDGDIRCWGFRKARKGKKKCKGQKKKTSRVRCVVVFEIAVYGIVGWGGGGGEPRLCRMSWAIRMPRLGRMTLDF